MIRPRATRNVPRKNGAYRNTVRGKKWCPQCAAFLLLDAFGLDCSREDGLSGWCRECRAKDSHDRRSADIEGYRAQTRARYRKHPAKWHAKVAVARAIAKGQLTKPAACPKCFKVRRIEAHHHLGYEKKHWLDVVWRCRSCHALEHKRGDLSKAVAA